MRTPDELRLSQIASFFGVTVEFLRRDNNAIRENLEEVAPHSQPPLYQNIYGAAQPSTGTLREADAPPYGLPSLRRDDNITSGTNVADLAIASARLLSMVGTTTKGVTEGKFDINKTIIVLRRLGDLLEHKIREADTAAGASQSL